ncbi:hypothetical protein HELRODRAFT_180411 [Helobdella robusta]|uniref:C-type lectin domain-containing protein n=1 Tax=Helobdella robusta TaxID=6412 RepID=T1FFW4_HELRO|nr:hypothetical protein HELRODRAFT_180411 [Helobdella robusta]ESN93991.1 hypothetical protein HELRODRAFT_180411 [Helobdella robusta]
MDRSYTILSHNTKNSVGFWSAGHRQGRSNLFYWRLFKPSRFVNPQCECGYVVGLKRWGAGQPDNSNNDEDCMELYVVRNQPTGPIVFNDISCTKHKMCALCQTDEI